MATYMVGVVSHIGRDLQRQRLRDQLMPDLIEVDDGMLGCMGNHLKTLEVLHRGAHRVGADWVVVLEDDAVPVLDFHFQLSMALDVAPSPIVSLYNGQGYPMQRQAKFINAVASGECWILHPYMRHAVGYALRSECFELGVLDEMGKLARRKWAPDDALSAWARFHSTPVAYMNPSIVDHEDGPSVIESRMHKGRFAHGRKRPRKAHSVGGRLEWDSGSVIVA